MNWSRGIVLAFILFAGFIITFVVKMMRTDTTGIPEKYYEKGLDYQEVIDAKEGAVGFGPVVKAHKGGGVDLYFEKAAPDSGTLYLQRPSDASRNISNAFQYRQGDTLTMPVTGTPGYWNAALEFYQSGKKYIYQTRIWVD